MRNRVLLGLMFMVLAACKQRTVPEYNVQRDSKYSIIDSTAKTDRFRVFDAKDRFAWYPIYYLGDTKETYELGANPIKSRARETYRPTATGGWFDKNISVFVDTALDIAHKSTFTHEVVNENRKVNDPEIYVTDSVKHFKAYPVFIKNTCDSTIYLGYFNYVNFMVLEAKNEQGSWVEIETLERQAGCGVGARVIFLRPHQVIVAKILRYNGGFKTMCRLKLGNPKLAVYSNTFTEYIDKRMLTSISKRPEYIPVNKPNKSDTGYLGDEPLVK